MRLRVFLVPILASLVKPRPYERPAVFVKTMVCWGGLVSRAQKTWLWSLLFKVFRLRKGNRDFKIYDAVVNESAIKQQYHWLKEDK